MKRILNHSIGLTLAAFLLFSCEKEKLETDIENLVEITMFFPTATGAEPDTIYDDQIVSQANGKTKVMFSVTLVDERLDRQFRSLEVIVPEGAGSLNSVERTTNTLELRPDVREVFELAVGTTPGTYPIKFRFGSDDHIVVKNVVLTDVPADRIFNISISDTAGKQADGVSVVHLSINPLGVQHPAKTMQLTLTKGRFESNGQKTLDVELDGIAPISVGIVSELNELNYVVTASVQGPDRSRTLNFSLDPPVLGSYLSLATDTSQGLLANGASVVTFTATVGNGHPAASVVFSTNAGHWENGSTGPLTVAVADGIATARLNLGTHSGTWRVDTEIAGPAVRQSVSMTSRPALVESIDVIPSSWSIDSTEGTLDLRVYYARTSGQPSANRLIQMSAVQDVNGQPQNLGVFEPYPIKTNDSGLTEVAYALAPAAYNDAPIEITTTVDGITKTIVIYIRE